MYPLAPSSSCSDLLGGGPSCVFAPLLLVRLLIGGAKDPEGLDPPVRNDFPGAILGDGPRRLPRQASMLTPGKCAGSFECETRLVESDGSVAYL